MFKIPTCWYFELINLTLLSLLVLWTFHWYFERVSLVFWTRHWYFDRAIGILNAPLVLWTFFSMGIMNVGILNISRQDGQPSVAHISPWQSISSSQFPPPFCLWRTLLDLKVAEIIPLPTPWLCHCVLMKGSDRGGVTSSKDCLLAFWQIALCGQERGQVARVSFGEAHWTAGGWSTGCGGDWECFPRGTPWSQPFSGVKVDGQL